MTWLNHLLQFIRMTLLIYIWHSYLQHDSFMCSIHACDVTHSYATCIYVTRLIHIWCSCVKWLMHMWRSAYTQRFKMWHDESVGGERAREREGERERGKERKYTHTFFLSHSLPLSLARSFSHSLRGGKRGRERARDRERVYHLSVLNSFSVSFSLSLLLLPSSPPLLHWTCVPTLPYIHTLFVPGWNKRRHAKGDCRLFWITCTYAVATYCNILQRTTAAHRNTPHTTIHCIPGWNK